MEPRDQVVVSGVGAWTSLGDSLPATWQRLLLGDAVWQPIGWPPIVWPPSRRQPLRVAGLSRAADFGPGFAPDRPQEWTLVAPVWAEPHAPRLSQPHADELAIRVMDEAVASAGLTAADLCDPHVGIVFGSSKGDFAAWPDVLPRRGELRTSRATGRRTAAGVGAMGERPARGLSDVAAVVACEDDVNEITPRRRPPSVDARPWTRLWPSGPLDTLTQRYRLTGPSSCVVAACATGLAAVELAARWIQTGLCDRVLAGSVDASLCPAVLGSFRRLGVLATAPPGEFPVCRPLDRRRNGFLLGAGAAALVLERESLVRARGRRPCARWLAGLSLTDSHHLLELDPTGQPLAELIRRVLQRAGIEAAAIDAVHLHGTATRLNDRVEAQALGRAGITAPGVALKGQLGHLLGAAGSVELAVAVAALQSQQLPASVADWQPDPECPVQLLSAAESRRQRYVLKLSLGFGGHLSAAVLESVVG